MQQCNTSCNRATTPCNSAATSCNTTTAHRLQLVQENRQRFATRERPLQTEPRESYRVTELEKAAAAARIEVDPVRMGIQLIHNIAPRRHLNLTNETRAAALVARAEQLGEWIYGNKPELPQPQKLAALTQVSHALAAYQAQCAMNLRHATHRVHTQRNITMCNAQHSMPPRKTPPLRTTVTSQVGHMVVGRVCPAIDSRLSDGGAILEGIDGQRLPLDLHELTSYSLFAGQVSMQ